MTTKDIVPAIQKQISPLMDRATNLVVKDEKTMLEAAEILSTINKSLDRITEEKEKVTKPLNQALKVERGRWKPMEDLHETAIAHVRKQMSIYQTKATEVADKEAAKIAARVGEGPGKLKPETAVRKMSEIDAPSKSVSTAAGNVRFKKVQNFEITSVADLPDDYKTVTPNTAAIRKAMFAGIQVAGVRYFTEQVPDNIR